MFTNKNNTLVIESLRGIIPALGICRLSRSCLVAGNAVKTVAIARRKSSAWYCDSSVFVGIDGFTEVYGVL